MITGVLTVGRYDYTVDRCIDGIIQRTGVLTMDRYDHMADRYNVVSAIWFCSRLDSRVLCQCRTCQIYSQMLLLLGIHLVHYLHLALQVRTLCPGVNNIIPTYYLHPVLHSSSCFPCKPGFFLLHLFWVRNFGVSGTGENDPSVAQLIVLMHSGLDSSVLDPPPDSWQASFMLAAHVRCQ